MRRFFAAFKIYHPGVAVAVEVGTTESYYAIVRRGVPVNPQSGCHLWGLHALPGGSPLFLAPWDRHPDGRKAPVFESTFGVSLSIPKAFAFVIVGVPSPNAANAGATGVKIIDAERATAMSLWRDRRRADDSAGCMQCWLPRANECGEAFQQ